MSTILQVNLPSGIKCKLTYDEFINKNIVISPSSIELASSEGSNKYVRTKDKKPYRSKSYCFLYKEGGDYYIERFDMLDDYDYNDIKAMILTYDGLNRMYELV